MENEIHILVCIAQPLTIHKYIIDTHRSCANKWFYGVEYFFLNTNTYSSRIYIYILCRNIYVRDAKKEHTFFFVQGVENIVAKL